MDFIQQTISNSFFQNIMLIIVTGILTGIFVPIIKSDMDDKKARRSEIIRSQIDLLNNLTKLFWDYHILLFELVYYRAMEKNNVKKYDKAILKYDDSWEIYTNIFIEMSKAQRLISKELYQKIDEFHKETNKLERDIWTLVNQDSTDQEWNNMHQRVYYDSFKKLKYLLNLLAEELNLS